MRAKIKNQKIYASFRKLNASFALFGFLSPGWVIFSDDSLIFKALVFGEVQKINYKDIKGASFYTNLIVRSTRYKRFSSKKGGLFAIYVFGKGDPAILMASSNIKKIADNLESEGVKVDRTGEEQHLSDLLSQRLIVATVIIMIVLLVLIATL